MPDPPVHVPPGVALVRVTEVPAQNGVEPPVIAAGTGETVKTAVEVPVVPTNVMVAVPADTPVTTPVVAPTVAIATLLLDHVPGPITPEDEESNNVLVDPTQAPKVP
jgi:hypothetical protein